MSPPNSEPYVNETMVPKNRVASRIAFDADSCGIQSYVAKIRGGQLAEIDEFPWMAMLLYERGKFQGSISVCLCVCTIYPKKKY